MFDEKNLPPGLEQEDWDDFVAHRKEIGKPMTDTAKRRMLMKLYRMKEAGEDVSQALERSMVNGWQDVWPVPPEQKQSRHTTHQEAPREKLPEISDEERERNLEYLRQETAKVFNFTGGRK